VASDEWLEESVARVPWPVAREMRIPCALRASTQDKRVEKRERKKALKRQFFGKPGAVPRQGKRFVIRSANDVVRGNPRLDEGSHSTVRN
jgi:hypothetical protein